MDRIDGLDTTKGPSPPYPSQVRTTLSCRAVFPAVPCPAAPPALYTWEVTPGNKPPKIPQKSHLNGV